MHCDTPHNDDRIIGNIDTPHLMQVFDSDDILVRGWFYSHEGSKSIEIFFDDVKIGNALRWGERIDLKRACPQYKNIEKSGFIFYKNMILENGRHKLLIRVKYDNDKIFEEFRDIIVDKRVCIIDRINIELTNHCNLTCLWCPGSGERNKGFMSFDTFTTILNNILSDKIIVNEIHLYNVGESLLHPDFPKIVQFLGALSKKPKIVLVTNGTLLSDSIMDQIIESKGIDTIQFSIDGGTKESYEQLRQGAKWEDTLKKISHFLQKNNKRIKTGLITIDMGVPFSEEFKKIIEKVDNFDFRPPHNWTGNEDLKDYPFERSFNPHPCWHIQNNLAILWNGDITLCCADLHGRGIFGNIHLDTLENFWKGHRLTTFRKQMTGRKKEIELCKNCSIL